MQASADGSIAIGIDVDPLDGRADSGDLELDLSELLVELGTAAAEFGAGVLLLVDELQEIPRSDIAALAGAAHRANRLRLPVAVCGAGLPNLPTLDDARVGVGVAQSELRDSFYGPPWERAAPAQKAYLSAMAAEETTDGTASSGRVATRVGKSHRDLSTSRDHLIRRGLIYAPARGLVAFTIPGMAAFIRNNMDWQRRSTIMGMPIVAYTCV